MNDPPTGKVAAVTGAASGLGRALACELARRGAALAVCDVDLPGLEETARLVKDRGADVLAEQVDVTDVPGVRAFAQQVRDRFGVVHQLYNNAGIGCVGRIDELSYDDLRRTFEVDYWGVVHGTKEFLPHLVASGDGHVVNISSVFGLVAPPHLAAYDAAKFAVRGFTEALRAELLASRAPVQVTCVHPGGIRTAFVRHSTVLPAYDRAALERRFRRVAFSTPERAARTILNGVERNKARVLVGPDAYLLDLAQRLMVARYQRLAAWTARWAVPRVGD